MKKIVISGAGLCGSLLAIALKKLGHDVLLFEKRSDLRLESASAGKSINLILTKKGMKALSEVGLLEGALSFTKPVLGRMMHAIDGELTYQPYGRDESEKNYSISRSELNKYLLAEAEKTGVTIHFSSELIDLNFKDSYAEFEGHAHVCFDFFFGADGAGSQTRKIMRRENLVQDKTTPLGTGYKELFMPPGTDGSYQIDQNALHIWPRGEHMLMALPNLDGSFTMTIYMSDERFQALDSADKIESYFQEFYPDSIDLMPDYISDLLDHPVGFLGSLEVSPWVHGNVILIGDAAHAIVPFFGQGMNCSFSDVEYIRTKLTSGDDWKVMLESYNLHQKLNGDAIRDLSLENFVEMSETVGRDDFIFRKRVEHIIENKFPEKYRSRYARVVYTLMPYHEAKRIGEIQKNMLDELCQGLKTPEDVDLAKAERLIKTNLESLSTHHK